MERIPHEYETLKTEKAMIQKENEDLKAKCEFYKEQVKTYRSRYESLISDRLSTPSIDSENLSDKLRPSAVANRWRYLKDQLYFQAYFELHDLLKDKPQAWHILLTVCKKAFKTCKTEFWEFQKVIKVKLFDPIEQQNADIGVIIKQGVDQCLRGKMADRELQRLAVSLQERYHRAGQAFLSDTRRQAMGEIKRFAKLAETEQTSTELIQSLFPPETEDNVRLICEEFAKECLLLCRAMMLQEPTMHLDFDHDPGAAFRTRDFDVHDGKEGEDNLLVGTLLLPALLRQRGGPLLERGLATARKAPLRRPHTSYLRKDGRHQGRQKGSLDDSSLPTPCKGPTPRRNESTMETYFQRPQTAPGQASRTHFSIAEDASRRGEMAEPNSRGRQGGGKTTTFTLELQTQSEMELAEPSGPDTA